MEFTVLMENTAPIELKKEWGLCIHIEYEGKKYLLDAGATDQFIQNAEALDVSLEEVDIAVLSHAHYDHGGGIPAFFGKNKKAEFLLREGCGEDCYGRKFLFYGYIGLRRGLFREFPDRLHLVSGDYQPAPGVWLIPHKTQGLKQKGKECKLYRREGFRYVPDDFSHEQSLVFETEQGLVIFNSCSHAGADVIIREVQETFPGQSVYGIVGGFHLFQYPPEKVRELAKRIEETGILRVYTGHCTGRRAFAVLKEELGEKAVYLETGLKVRL